MANSPTAVGVKVTFYFRKLEFNDGVLKVIVGSDVEDQAEISFEFVRIFAFLKESDFHSDIRKYQRLQLIRGDESMLGVYRLTQGAILERILNNRIDDENPQYFFVSTPDECLEVVGFSDPKIKLLT